MTASPRINTSGFTLLELALVLTIISLLVGAIMAGATAIKNARLHAMMADIASFTEATQAFRDKYHYLPGDFPDAQSFWSAASNGDGNGHISDRWLGAGDNELFGVWQQLALAGFIKGSYSGASGGGSGYEALPGVNVPASPYQPGGYTLLYVQPQNFTLDPAYFPALYGHMITFGAKSAGDFTRYPVMPPDEAFIVDSKMDDGMPASGKVMAAKSALMPNCTTSDTPSLSQYNTTYKTVACGLFFLTGL